MAEKQPANEEIRAILDKNPSFHWTPWVRKLLTRVEEYEAGKGTQHLWIELDKLRAELKEERDRCAKTQEAYEVVQRQAEWESDENERLELRVRRLLDGACQLAGPGHGDCSNAVGMPGLSVPDQHDGPDDTVDVYGKPNGWCWFCWLSREQNEWKKLHAMECEARNAVEDENERLKAGATKYGYHKSRCVVMREMRGSTPIASSCDCGWQDFYNDEVRQTTKDASVLPPESIRGALCSNCGACAVDPTAPVTGLCGGCCMDNIRAGHESTACRHFDPWSRDRGPDNEEVDPNLCMVCGLGEAEHGRKLVAGSPEWCEAVARAKKCSDPVHAPECDSRGLECSQLEQR